MQLADRPAPPVVRAAQQGNPAALDELVGGFLPLVYNVVGRAADADLDVDDIVQETMLRVVAGLPELRDVTRARSWVVSIAVHQLTDARRSARTRRARVVPSLPEEHDPADPASDFTGLSLLRGSLSREQQEVARAAAWLDTGYRDLLAGWWLEVAGELDRAELAAAYGQSPGAVAVQIKRMREQLNTGRSVVRALAARRCPELGGLAASWDGVPSPLWRKRIARHIRDCGDCSSRSARLVPPERLLAGVGLTPVPAALLARSRFFLSKVSPRATPTPHVAGGPGPRSPRLVARTARGGRAALHLGTGAGAKLAATAAAVVLAAAGVTAWTVTGAGASSASFTTHAGHVRAHPARRAHPSARPPVTLPQHPASQAPAPPSAKAAATTPAVASSPAPIFSGSVPAVPGVAAVTSLGAITQGPRVAGRDNGQSAQYGSQAGWIFDDTTLKDPFGFLSNSGAATTDLDAAGGITLTSGNPATDDPGQTPVQLIPLTAAEKSFQAAHAASTGCTAATDPYCGVTFAFWPGPVVADPGHGRILFTYGKLCRGGGTGTPCSGPLGKGLGTGIASLDMSTGQVTRLTAANGPDVTSVEGHDPTMFFPDGGGYSAAALVTGGDLYLYGNCDYACRVARVPLAQVTDRAQWRFYAGNGAWSTDPATATGLIDPGGAGQTVFYDGALKAWVNMFMPYQSAKIMFQVGGSPWGPWSAAHTASSIGVPADYALFAHPEYAEDGGLVEYLSYFRPSDGSQQLVRLQFKPATG